VPMGSMINVHIKLFRYEILHFGHPFVLDIKGGEHLGPLFTLDVKGEGILVFLVISNSFYSLQ